MIPKLNVLLDATRKFIRKDAHTNLGKMLAKLHPADIAELLKHLSPSERIYLFDLLTDKEQIAKVFSELDAMTRSEMLEHMSSASISELLKEMAHEDVADIIGDMPQDVAQSILESLGPRYSQEVEKLLKYEKDTAGGIMTKDFFALPESTTVQKALDLLRAAEHVEMIFYIYVIDDQQRLVGIVSLRKLIITPPDSTLKRIMVTEVIHVKAYEDQEDVARLVEKYNILSVPVVDRMNKLVGIITVDDIIDVIRAETTEDIYMMAGTSSEELFERSVWKIASIRLPWLMVSLIGETFSGFILKYYHGTMQSMIAVTFFIPMIMALGGNVGNQSQTIVVRGLGIGKIIEDDMWKILFKQLRIGLAMGIIAGSSVAIISLLIQTNYALCFVVGLSLFISITVSGTMGVLAPFLLKKFHIDPAIGAGPFITNFNDITGIFIYLGLVTFFLSYIA